MLQMFQDVRTTSVVRRKVRCLLIRLPTLKQYLPIEIILLPTFRLIAFWRDKYVHFFKFLLWHQCLQLHFNGWMLLPPSCYFLNPQSFKGLVFCILSIQFVGSNVHVHPFSLHVHVYNMSMPVYISMSTFIVRVSVYTWPWFLPCPCPCHCSCLMPIFIPISYWCPHSCPCPCLGHCPCLMPMFIRISY